MSFMKRLVPGGSNESYSLSSTSSTRTETSRSSTLPSQGISGNYNVDHTELGSLPVLVTPKPFENRKMEYRSVSASSSMTSSTSQSLRGSQEQIAQKQAPPTPKKPPKSTDVQVGEEVSGPFPPASASSTPLARFSPLQAEWGFVHPPQVDESVNEALRLMNERVGRQEEQRHFSEMKHQDSGFSMDGREHYVPIRVEGRESFGENRKPQPAQRHFQSANPVQTFRTVPANLGFGSPQDPIPTVPMPQSMQTPKKSSLQHFQETGETPPLVKMYEAILNGPLAEFLNLSSQIGGDVTEMANLVKEAFNAQRDFLWKSAGMAKPADGDLPALLGPMSEKIQAIQEGRNAKRQSAQFSHLSALSEGIPALGWVTVAPTPCPFIKEMIDASQFYTNRVLKEFKEKDRTHVDWVKAWLQVLNELHAYVKQNYTTGLTWNSVPGASPTGATGGQPVPPPPGPGGPPPPPPPPPADLFAGLDKGSKQSTDDDSRSALFAEINKGTDITKGLKKVTDDMKTHKNPELREQQPIPDKSKPALAPKPTHLTNGTAAAKRATPPPVCELQGGKKWIVEYQKSNHGLVIEPQNMKQVVYIYKCQDTVVQIKGKINSVTMDSCKKTSVVFDDLVACVEIINCQSAQVQTLGKLPTLGIQKTDGCQVYLSRDSLDAEIVSSKSSEMNIVVPDDTGDFTEHVVPEQFKTVWTGKGLKTTAVDIG